FDRTLPVCVLLCLFVAKKTAIPVSRDCRQWSTALRADERLAVHPIGVTTHLAERADLEVIDSSHGKASDGGLPGTGNCNYRPGTEYTTCSFECVVHVESEGALLTLGFHNDFAAVISAINRAELRLRQRFRRRLDIQNGRKTAGAEDRRIIVARALGVVSE